MSGISFESRFERRVNPSLSEYMRSMEIKEKENSSPRPTTLSLRRKEERPLSRSLSPRPTSPKKKSGGKKSVTFQDEVKRQPRPSRSRQTKYRKPKWLREVPEAERRKQVERTCYSPSDYCLDLAKEHNDKRCHTAASRCYLAALEYTPGDRRIHSAFKTSLAFVRNNRPYFDPKSARSRSVK